MPNTSEPSQSILTAKSSIATVSESSVGPSELVEANSFIYLTFSKSITVIYDTDLYVYRDINNCIRNLLNNQWTSTKYFTIHFFFIENYIGKVAYVT